MIDASFVDRIANLAATEVITADGKDYTSKIVFNPPRPDEPVCDPLAVATLSGLADFTKVATALEQLKLLETIIHVESATVVRFYSRILGVTRHRECYVIAEVPGEGFRFGEFMPHANFMIALQSQFVRTFGDWPKMMQILGTIKAEASKTSRDDGISQTVVAAQGIALNQEVSLPNPVMLKPRRTFVEVDQPPSEFVLRVQDKPGQLPLLALFEGDGGAWANEAMQNIKEFLSEKLAGTGIVILA